MTQRKDGQRTTRGRSVRWIPQLAVHNYAVANRVWCDRYVEGQNLAAWTDGGDAEGGLERHRSWVLSRPAVDGIRRGETGLAGSEQVAGNGRVSLARTDRVGVPVQPAVFVAVAAMVSGVVHLAARRSGEAAPAAEAETLSTLAGDVLRREAALPALLDRVGQTFALTSVGLLEQGPEVADGAGGRRFGRRSAQPQGSAAGRRSSASGMAPGRRLRPGTSACPTSTESSRHRDPRLEAPSVHPPAARCLDVARSCPGQATADAACSARSRLATWMVSS